MLGYALLELCGYGTKYNDNNHNDKKNNKNKVYVISDILYSHRVYDILHES